MKSLYHISNQYMALMNAIEENEGEITPELEELLNSNETDREDLLNAMCTEIRNSQNDVAAVKSEMERLGERIASNENKQERLKVQITKVLRFFGMVNPVKGKTNYTFKTALFSGYTKETETITFDDARLEEFSIITKAALLKLQEDTFSTNPEEITVNKISNFVSYKIIDKIDRILACQLVEDGEINQESIVPVIDKNAAKEYIKMVKGITEGEAEIDPIASLAIYNTKESLIVK